MSDVLRRLLVVLGVAVAGTCWVVAPAGAAADQLQLSWDRAHWSNSLAGTVFDSTERWVPGDVARRTFYVRDDGSGTATLSVTMTSTMSAAPRDLRLATRIGAGSWESAAGATARVRLGGLERGAVLPVRFRAELPAGSTGLSAGRTATLRVRVNLAGTGSTGSGDGSGGRDGTGAGHLPATGAPELGWWVLAAGACLAAGAVLIRRGCGVGTKEDHG
ncbi:MAG: hypothetical protein QM638_11855 [Nocardioides sp.]|uniref:hypothetical protein n=1 Tax=Nocardioides sp. TaxID=35761 RepID=UPI0039E447AE